MITVTGVVDSTVTGTPAVVKKSLAVVPEAKSLCICCCTEAACAASTALMSNLTLTDAPVTVHVTCCGLTPQLLATAAAMLAFKAGV